MSESDALIRPSLPPSRLRRCCVGLLVVGSILLVAIGVCIAFLFPRVPVIELDSVAMTGASIPKVELLPPTLSIPLSLLLLVSNANFFGIDVVSNTRIRGFFMSKTQGNVTIGESYPSLIRVPSRSTNVTVALDVVLQYALFQSSVVLSEIVADCGLRKMFLVIIEANLVLDVLFLNNLRLNVSVPVNVSCTT
jgi:hypothetical protein